MSSTPERLRTSLLVPFLEEFESELQAISLDWSNYSDSQDDPEQTLLTARRKLHNLKGTTRLLGLQEAPEMVHQLEELVDQARESGRRSRRFLPLLRRLKTVVDKQLSKAADNEAQEDDALEVQSQEAERFSPLDSDGFQEVLSFLSTADEVLDLVKKLRTLISDLNQPMDFQARSREVLDLIGVLESRSLIARGRARRLSLFDSMEAFAGLEELAFKVAEETHKKVHVHLDVEAGRLPRELVLSIRAALLHLIQNSVSHGLPSSGGELLMRYRREEGCHLFEISDNGTGLPIEKLGEALVSRGVLSRQAWMELEEQERLQWFFRRGVTTKEVADQASGRGIGLSLVGETMERLGGRIDIKTGDGGTSFKLSVPQRWNLRPTLEVWARGQKFLVLLQGLQGVESSLGSTAIQEQSKDLAALLGFHQGQEHTKYVLKLGSSQDSHLIGVERVGVMAETLVLPLEGIQNISPAIVGVSVNQGRPVLVVLLEKLTFQGEPDAFPQSPQEAERSPPVLLVVDDSKTTRSLLLGILQSGGYEVLVAACAEEALQTLAQTSVDLVVSDYQMPGMDGLQFLEVLRKQPEGSQLGFVLLTSIDDVNTFEKASLLGADRCLGKQNFSEEHLLKTIEELL